MPPPPRHLGVLPRLVESGLRAYGRATPSSIGAFQLVRAARRLVPRASWQGAFDTPGGVMRLDLGTYPDWSMAYGLYERETERVIRRLVRPGGHFVDVGANIGYFTLLAARRVGSTGRVDAFEPQPDNRARLVENVHVNELSARVRIHPVALSDRPGQARIHTFLGAGGNHGSASLFAAADDAAPSTAVPTARLDDLLAGATPDAIKIDVEGAEPLVVAGMTELLKRHRPPVIMEWPGNIADVGGMAARLRIDRMLAAVPAYRIYVLRGPRPRPLEPTDAALAALPQTNLLFRVGPPPS